MARMIPAHVSRFSRCPKKLRAEKRIFDLLKDDPGAQEWTVLHSVGLDERFKKSLRVHGEIDFVIIVPGEGIVCMEVKGGGLRRENGTWYRGQDPLRESPYDQAKESMYAFRRHLTAKFGSDVCPTNFMLAFPDIPAPLIGTEIKSCAVVDENDLADDEERALSRCIKKFAHEVLRTRGKNGRGVRSPRPTPKQVDKIVEFLRGDFDRVVSTGASIRQTEEKLLELTDEQYERLDSLEGNARCVIHGGAGTGKTMLALEYARRADRKGLKVLLVCYNKRLGGWLQKQTEGTNIKAGTCHGVARELIGSSTDAKEAFDRESGESVREELFARLQPKYGRRALEELGLLFDVLVVDEAQDVVHNRLMLDFLDCALFQGLGGGRWAIFGDFQRQALYHSELQEPAQAVSAFCDRDRMTVSSLNFNCRNTRCIAEANAALSGIDKQSLRFKTDTEPGQEVKCVYYKSDEELVASVTEILDGLVTKGEIDGEEVVILSPLRLKNSGLWRQRALASYHFEEVGSESDSPPGAGSAQPTVKFSTIQAFKGLESPVVILVDIIDKMDDWEDKQSLLYVGTSRATSLLRVLVHENARGWFEPLMRQV